MPDTAELELEEIKDLVARTHEKNREAIENAEEVADELGTAERGLQRFLEKLHRAGYLSQH